MRRLYLQIYLAICGILGLFVVFSSFGLLTFRDIDRLISQGAAATLAELLPGSKAPAGELEAALARLGKRFEVDIAVYGRGHERIAAAGAELPAQLPAHVETGWLRHWGPPTVALELPDGRWLLARPSHHERRHLAWFAMLGLLIVAIGVGAYPLARRITGRLERLGQRVEALGAGDLSARVEVEGRDEVARLATSFNRAAERIERLVAAQRRALAMASHELRTPLARLRVAVELLAGDGREELRQRASRDIAELDDLIGELLIASRLQAGAAPSPAEPVELLGLVAEEAAPFDAEVAGEEVLVRGDARLLRRLARNLFENARRYGNGTPIEVSVARLQTGARLRVEDRGPGVAPGDRERVFEPFYRSSGSADGGVGLGLALVRQIARHHGGEARCLAREGGGTRIEVEFGTAVATL